VNCAQARELIGAHLDGELDVMSSLDFERHLECCTACARARERIEGVRSATAVAPYFRAPEALAGRIGAALRREVAPAPSRWRLAGMMRPLAVAAALVVVATMSWHLARTSSGASGLERELVAAHVRSLQADHLLDVASSNQHTVKPWFSGKIDFAPDVRDLAEAGFPLAGGRLDYVDGHAAVALVYRHNLHVINCFVWPAAAGSEAETATSSAGYSVLRFTDRGLTYWVVSDAAPGTLEEFARALRARGAAATMPGKSS
jgi:anti-sigma factor RsiW